MKSIKILFACSIAALTMSCNKEPMIQPDSSMMLSIDREDRDVVIAGESFYLIKQGAGEFFSYFDGTVDNLGDHRYDPKDPTRKGVNMTGDSVKISYSAPGTYDLTLVASSTGNWAEDFDRNATTRTITCIDDRTGVRAASAKGTNGRTAVAPPIKDNEIYFPIIDVPGFEYDKVSPVLSTVSPIAMVGYLAEGDTIWMANDGTDVVDFTGIAANPSTAITFVVKSHNGDCENFMVYVDKQPASDKAELVYIETKANGSYAGGQFVVFDQTTKTGVLEIEANVPTSLAFNAKFSESAKLEIKRNDKYSTFRASTRYKLVDIQSFRVTAENGTTTQEYTFSVNRAE